MKNQNYENKMLKTKYFTNIKDILKFNYDRISKF